MLITKIEQRQSFAPRYRSQTWARARRAWISLWTQRPSAYLSPEPVLKSTTFSSGLILVDLAVQSLGSSIVHRQVDPGDPIAPTRVGVNRIDGCGLLLNRTPSNTSIVVGEHVLPAGVEQTRACARTCRDAKGRCVLHQPWLQGLSGCHVATVRDLGLPDALNSVADGDVTVCNAATLFANKCGWLLRASKRTQKPW